MQVIYYKPILNIDSIIWMFSWFSVRANVY